MPELQDYFGRDILPGDRIVTATSMRQHQWRFIEGIVHGCWGGKVHIVTDGHRDITRNPRDVIKKET